ncbi:SDR family NAD(P)-dependent oxidoreductase [Leucobacter sp. GX24907]
MDGAKKMTLRSMFGLAGQTALITGAAGGLGRAHARALGVAGARLILADRDEESSEDAATALREEGFDAEGLRMNVLDLAQIDLAFTELDARDRAPSIVVNNAGVSIPHDALEASPQEFDLTFGVNARGAYFVAQAAARRMRERGAGSIVNIASIGAFTVDGRQSSVYDASKAAIAHMTTNMAYEWAPYGIRVNTIAPGYIHTAMTTQFLQDRSIEQEVVDTRIPLGRIGEPHDLSGALVYLCSPSAAWVTGQAIVVDGGWMSNY